MLSRTTCPGRPGGYRIPNDQSPQPLGYSIGQM